MTQALPTTITTPDGTVLTRVDPDALWMVHDEIRARDLWDRAETFARDIYGDRAATVTVEASSEYDDEGGYYWNITGATVLDTADIPCVPDFRLPFWQDEDEPWWVPFVVRADGATDALVITYDYQAPLRESVALMRVCPVSSGIAWTADTLTYDRDTREVSVRWRFAAASLGNWAPQQGKTDERRYPIDDLLAYIGDAAGFDEETLLVRHAASESALPLEATVREWLDERDAYCDYALAVDDECETVYDLRTPPDTSFAAIYMVKASPPSDT